MPEVINAEVILKGDIKPCKYVGTISHKFKDLLASVEKERILRIIKHASEIYEITYYMLRNECKLSVLPYEIIGYQITPYILRLFTPITKEWTREKVIKSLIDTAVRNSENISKYKKKIYHEKYDNTKRTEDIKKLKGVLKENKRTLFLKITGNNHQLSITKYEDIKIHTVARKRRENYELTRKRRENRELKRIKEQEYSREEELLALREQPPSRILNNFSSFNDDNYQQEQQSLFTPNTNFQRDFLNLSREEELLVLREQSPSRILNNFSFFNGDNNQELRVPKKDINDLFNHDFFNDDNDQQEQQSPSTPNTSFQLDFLNLSLDTQNDQPTSNPTLTIEEGGFGFVDLSRGGLFEHQPCENAFKRRKVTKKM